MAIRAIDEACWCTFLEQNFFNSFATEEDHLKKTHIYIYI